MMFWDWIGGAQSLCFVNGTHMFCKGIGACERTVTFYITIVVNLTILLIGGGIHLPGKVQ